MKSYFRMKYEQFLIRMFDKVVLLLSKTQSDWYPKHALCRDLEVHIDELEKKVCNLELENSKLLEENEIMEEYITEYM